MTLPFGLQRSTMYPIKMVAVVISDISLLAAMVWFFQ
jgi:hypothetical protein